MYKRPCFVPQHVARSDKAEEFVRVDGQCSFVSKRWFDVAVVRTSSSNRDAEAACASMTPEQQSTLTSAAVTAGSGICGYHGLLTATDERTVAPDTFIIHCVILFRSHHFVAQVVPSVLSPNGWHEGPSQED